MQPEERHLFRPAQVRRIDWGRTDRGSPLHPHAQLPQLGLQLRQRLHFNRPHP